MDTYDVLDDETANLILQLQISDGLELYETFEGKGKHREGELSDAQLALQIYTEDLKRHATIASDRQMTKSIARACQSDEEILIATQSQEQGAASDRETACRLGGVAQHTLIEPWTVGSEFLNDETLEKLKALYICAPVEDANTGGQTYLGNGDSTPESSEWAASRKVTTRPPNVQCTACQDDFQFYDTARAPCDHEYCRTCLKDLFRASITDDSLFPPKCCGQTIPAGSVRIHLTGDLIRQYEAKKIEYETPDRTYCSNVLCFAFIRVENIQNERATCPACTEVTCTMCKGKAHRGDCPADTALQLVLDTANENGWQRCYSCRRLVELDIGCNHITCPCGSEFCYVCARRWKTCLCPQWTEDRLFERANQVVARQPVRADLPQRIARVAAVAENLRTRHNCDHEQWRYARGQARCEECYHTLPSYIFECRQCNIQACNRCRRNRL
ncbi:putative E3 ubiquitin-protein ligase [Lachnellula hyalina]|uniref:RBR-type E3 ubiquitin transferase n=1 Tax=Lachnellula hyalina TaxID=1316788 RepID=A0A8H8RA55_9HELO|nr:putative E3 ubiquitin-protein ligase [Lachnellula hyalina]TVY29615.1 putative E3 ubiquitin-protein ligase [Lachnellula hyalina]